MGDEDEGDTGLGLDGLEFFAHGLAQLEVQGRQRLVQQQYLGVGGQGSGQGDALLLAAGQLVGLARRKALHLHQGQHLAHPLGDLRLAQYLAHRARFQAEGRFSARVMWGNSA